MRQLDLFQSLLLQVSFKTMRLINLTPHESFNPFSFRSPSKPEIAGVKVYYSQFQSLLLQVSFKTGPTDTSEPERVSIPSPSGLLQNNKFFPVHLRCSVSIPSPSGLLQNRLRPCFIRAPTFQSLLLQVSFKTFSRTNYGPWMCFNPFSFRSPSKRRCAPH